MSIMKREQQQVMTVVEAKADSGTDHSVLKLKVLLDRGTRGTFIWTKNSAPVPRFPTEWK
jgi:hypothetical protein